MIVSPSAAKTVIVREKPVSYLDSTLKNTLKYFVSWSLIKSVMLFLNIALHANKSVNVMNSDFDQKTN